MNKIVLFLAVLLVLILNSCGTQMDFVELQASEIDRLRLQAEDHFKKKEFDKAINAYKTLLNKTENPLSVDYFNLGRCYFINHSLKESDSVFTLLIERNPRMALGYSWRAKTRSRIDSLNNDFLPKTDFEKIIELQLDQPQSDYNKEMLIDAYLYMGFYYFSNSEFKKARDCYRQIMKLNPDPKSAQICYEVFKALDNLKL